MHNRWGIHAPNNARPRNMGEFFDAGFQNYTVLHGNENFIPEIRRRYPNARILVRMFLTDWDERDPADWTREITDFMNRNRSFTNEVTWANEQNLDIEGHPQGASLTMPVPPASLYQDIHNWNLEMIRRLRQSIPWARLHYPAFANDHSDDKNQGGYIGLEICRASIEAADVMDCHCYWKVDEGPLTLDGGQRFILTHNFFPNKPIFISECGNFAVRDARSPEQYVTWMHSLYHYEYVEGATFFIWDSDAAPENALNKITDNPALVRTLRETSKDAPAQLPALPFAPPPIVGRPAQPIPSRPEPVSPSGEYMVQPGDTLIGISKRFGVDVVTLMNANGIADARLLRAGQRLKIPGLAVPPSPTPAPAPAPAPEPAPEPVPVPLPSVPAVEGTLYIVRGGDTLGAIAKRFNVTVAALVVANSLTNANIIRPGQRLTIPKPGMVLSVAEAMASASAAPQVGVLGVGDPSTPVVSPREIQEFLAGKRTTFYITRKGDTIARVAALFHTDALVLSQINQVGTQGEIMPGTRLIIPMK